MEPIREEPAVQEPAREQAPEEAQRDMERILEELRWLEERKQQDRNWMEPRLTSISASLNAIQESQRGILKSQRLQQGCRVSMC